MLKALIPSSSAGRLMTSLIIGCLAGFAVASGGFKLGGLLTGIAATTFLFVALGWSVLWPLDAGETRRNVLREDFNAVMEELIVVAAELIALIGVIGLLVAGKSADNRWVAALAVAAVSMSWAGLHLMYATRYAHLFYRETPGGIDFNSSAHPAYRDFFYFSYNLGMTYQVSDTSVSDSAIRAVVLRHCLLSYIFGTVILATTVNLVISIVAP